MSSPIPHPGDLVWNVYLLLVRPRKFQIVQYISMEAEPPSPWGFFPSLHKELPEFKR